MSEQIEGCPQPETPIRERAWTAEQVEDSRCPTTYRREGAVKTLIGLGWKWDGQQWQAEQAGGGVSDEMVTAAIRAWDDVPPQLEYSLRMRRALEAVAPLLRAHAGQGGRVDEGVPGLCERNPAPNASPPMAAASPTIHLTAALAQNAQPQHPDDAAVDRFAAALKAKLSDARAKGRGGWNDDEPGMQQRLSDMLRAHVEKGDPRDVGNFAMFLHQRGESVLPAQNAQVEAVACRYRFGDGNGGWLGWHYSDQPTKKTIPGDVVQVEHLYLHVEQDAKGGAVAWQHRHRGYPDEWKECTREEFEYTKKHPDCPREARELYLHAERARVPSDWQPTPDAINALPLPVRNYIMALETNADPAGMVRENVLVREENEMLRALYANSERARVPAGFARIPDPKTGTTATAYDMARSDGWNACIEYMRRESALAAAPSQPEDAA